MTRASPLRLATSLFAECFASRPAVAASAPGRVNLIGEHLDYNGGPVLPLAIDRRTVAVAAPAESWEVVSEMDGQVIDLRPEGPNRGGWSDYVVGVIRVLRSRGITLPGARLAVASSVPIGAGLSSSAALAVAVGRALTMLVGRRVSAGDLADVAYHAEHDEVGVECGRMDQTISAFAEAGSALLIETSTMEMRRVPLAGKVWVLETGVSHKLSGGALNTRRRECEDALAICREHGVRVPALAALVPSQLEQVLRILPPPLGARVRHIVTETARTRTAAAALAQGNLPELGRFLFEGHESLRLDFQSSCDEADLLVASAGRRGAFGARLTGAGWGGAVIMLVAQEIEARTVAEMQEDFRQAFGRLPEAWWTKAAAGA
ncbi:MAG: galactokinase, partial [Gemmatimonadota bacterium]